MWRFPLMTWTAKPPRKLLTSVAICVAIASGLCLADEKPQKVVKTTAGTGRNLYNSSCAGCHGLDGHGSDKAVNIAAGSEVQRFSDAQVSAIIADGLPGTGMPAFHSLTAKQIEELVHYLRALQGKAQSQTLSGDSKRGQEIFFGKGGCSNCHTVSGRGGFLGPDLSAYAATVSAKAIHDEIVRARRNPSQGYRAAVLTTESGERLRGLIRNEDNFSVQFQAEDGSFHFLQRSDSPRIERLEASLMPTDYGDRLTSQEIDDLVNFLVSASPDAGKNPPSRKKEYEDE